jgi:hypothetical protein
MPIRFGNIVMNVGDRTPDGRTLEVIAKEYVFRRSRQQDPVALCVSPECTQGPDGNPWKREGKNAMGVGSRHAAAYGHRVVVTRHMVTDYDGTTPRGLDTA